MIGKVKSFSRQHGYGFIEAGDQEYSLSVRGEE